MSFPSNVEQWRPIVRNVLGDVLTLDSAKKSLIDRLGLTFDRLVDIILALIQKESSGDVNAVGDGGDSVGLMMLNYGAGTPQSFGYAGTKQDLYIPYNNLFYGCKYFLYQLARYGDVNSAILAYRSGQVSLTSKSLNYLSDVMKFLGQNQPIVWVIVLTALGTILFARRQIKR